MKIIIVEDDINSGALLKEEFEKQGYSVDLLDDKNEGLKRLKIHHSNYDLAILGLHQPGRQGHEICAELRDSNISLPVMMLVECNKVECKITALEVGADDCIQKPFLAKELVARARALLRRPKAMLPETLRVKDLELKPHCREVIKAGKKIHLTLKEFNILELLMRAVNQVVVRDTLLDKIWDFNFKGFSNVVDVHINHLRRKLAKATGRKSDKNIIETVRGVGYRITI